MESSRTPNQFHLMNPEVCVQFQTLLSMALIQFVYEDYMTQHRPQSYIKVCMYNLERHFETIKKKVKKESSKLGCNRKTSSSLLTVDAKCPS